MHHTTRKRISLNSSNALPTGWQGHTWRPATPKLSLQYAYFVTIQGTGEVRAHLNELYFCWFLFQRFCLQVCNCLYYVTFVQRLSWSTMIFFTDTLPVCHQPNLTGIAAGSNVTLTCNVQFSLPSATLVRATPHMSWNNNGNSQSQQSTVADTSASISITVPYDEASFPSYTCTITFSFESLLSGFELSSNNVSSSCSTVAMFDSGQ